MGEEMKSAGSSADDMAAFQSNFVQAFGAGVSYNVPGYGTMSQQAGSLEQLKQQSIVQYQQNQMVQAQARAMGLSSGSAAPQTSNFFTN
jgi:hypothetical protein